ncbi:MAG TPA: CHAT domain-containing tetratricopeptide repeat protein [Candidatus Polarisedimenticolia bacterium]|nr:CHAT domain-containing tetratricopeptide repeat protein [Candidatus Polarisedimenticolia bacterium]
MSGWRMAVAATSVVVAATSWFGATATMDETGQRARDALKAGRYQEAETLAREALRIAENDAGPESKQAAEILDLLVEALYRGGRSGQAETLSLAERAVALKEKAYGPDDPQTADSLHNLGTVYRHRGQDTESRSTFERALAIRETALGARSVEVGKTVAALAVVARQSGDIPTARAMAERALSIFEEKLGPISPDVAKVLNTLANLHKDVGDLETAAPLYERSLSIWEKTVGPDHPEVAWSVNNLAVLRLLMGDLVGARSLFERALALREKTLGQEHPDVATSLLNLASALDQLGDLEAALSLVSRALSIREQAFGPEHQEVAAALLSLGTVEHHLWKLETAQAHYERALAIMEKDPGPGQARLAPILKNLGVALYDRGRFAEARSCYERALAIREAALGPNHPDVARYLTNLANVLWRVDDLPHARPLQARALSIRESAFGPDHPKVSESLINLAALDLKEGLLGDALDRSLRATSIVRRHFQEVARSLTEREAFGYAANLASGMNLALSVFSRGSHAILEPGAASRLADAAIRTRALVLDEVAARHRATLATQDQATQALLKTLDTARSRIARLLMVEEDSGGSADYRKRLEAARTKKEQAERAVAERSRALGEEESRSDIGLDEVRRALPSETALVSFLQYSNSPAALSGPSRNRNDEPSYIAIVLPPGGVAPAVIPLGEVSTIDSLVTRWRAEVASPPSDQEAMTKYWEAGERLRRAIWDPVARQLASSRVVMIVPDGALSLVSFATLPTRGGRYLLETGPLLHYLSAERDLVRRVASDSIGHGALVMGGPDFDSAAAPEAASPQPDEVQAATFRGTRSACGGFRAVSFAPLPSSQAEADEVSTALKTLSSLSQQREDVVELTGRAASETAFRRQAPGRRLIHLATHGYFVQDRCDSALAAPLVLAAGGYEERQRGSGGENPLVLSGLVFAGANLREQAPPDGDDGILSAEEIASLDLREVEWAVLSACNTGTGPVRVGEGVLGLRRTFQIAGARTIIMSLWGVEDHAARDWIRRLYEARRDGVTTPEAITKASLGILESRRRAGVVTHPFFWGGFVASGDWR